MVPAGRKTKRFSSVNHTTKTVHHHHALTCNIFRKSGCFNWPPLFVIALAPICNNWRNLVFKITTFAPIYNQTKMTQFIVLVCPKILTPNDMLCLHIFVIDLFLLIRVFVLTIRSLWLPFDSHDSGIMWSNDFWKEVVSSLPLGQWPIILGGLWLRLSWLRPSCHMIHLVISWYLKKAVSSFPHGNVSQTW